MQDAGKAELQLLKDIEEFVRSHPSFQEASVCSSSFEIPFYSPPLKHPPSVEGSLAEYAPRLHPPFAYVDPNAFDTKNLVRRITRKKGSRLTSFKHLRSIKAEHHFDPMRPEEFGLPSYYNTEYWADAPNNDTISRPAPPPLTMSPTSISSDGQTGPLQSDSTVSPPAKRPRINSIASLCGQPLTPFHPLDDEDDIGPVARTKYYNKRLYKKSRKAPRPLPLEDHFIDAVLNVRPLKG